MQRLTTKPVDASIYVTFDFEGLLDDGVTLVGPATVAKETLSGTDPSAAGLTVGSPQMLSPLVQALVSLGVDGAAYKLSCLCPTSSGETLKVIARLPVGDPDY